MANEYPANVKTYAQKAAYAAERAEAAKINQDNAKAAGDHGAAAEAFEDWAYWSVEADTYAAAEASATSIVLEDEPDTFADMYDYYGSDLAYES